MAGNRFTLLPAIFMIMKLTAFDLQKLKNSLESTLQIVKDIQKPLQNPNVQFNSRQDYLEALESEGKLPERLYNFMFKDVYVAITYSVKTDMYHIVCKNFYSHVLDDYKTFRSQSWIVGNSLDFAKCVFSKVIIDFFEKNILPDGLF